MTVHGSPSLSPVPYGALSPYLADLSVEDVTSKVAVLRALWAHLESGRKGPGPTLLLVDDAHDLLDTATAEMISATCPGGLGQTRRYLHSATRHTPAIATALA